MYWAEIYMRAFNPYDALEAHFPVRKRAWAPAARVFGYRVAQMSGGGALDSRGGPWYSRRSEHVSGSLEIEYPALNSIPEQVDVRIRLSWWPPRVTIIWLGAGLYRKLSSRPATGPPCDWKDTEYDDRLFAEEVRASHHAYSPTQEKVPSPVFPSRPER